MMDRMIGGFSFGELAILMLLFLRASNFEAGTKSCIVGVVVGRGDGDGEGLLGTRGIVMLGVDEDMAVTVGI